jgi:prevent-host-death family protein
MCDRVPVRELRQNLSRYLDRVKAGEDLTVTEHGRPVARLVPLVAEPYREIVERYGGSVPVAPLAEIAASLSGSGHPAGTTDALLAELRAERFP